MGRNHEKERYHKKQSRSGSRSRSVIPGKKRNRSRSGDRERHEIKSSRRCRRSHSRDHVRRSHSRVHDRQRHSRGRDREYWSAELKSSKKDVKPILVNFQLPPKKSSLGNDSDEEMPVIESDVDINQNKKDSADEKEIDSLDAFMAEHEEKACKVTKIKHKGEVMEQNQDVLEYSGEDECENLHKTAASPTNKLKRELAKVDHADTQYLTFRKDFYFEIPEIARMTNKEVELYKGELEVKVKGKGCPKPIKSWAQCGITKKELEVLRKLGHEKPTPIQCQAIPAIMSGRDLIGRAKTGSGKTLAFLLPMMRHILDQPSLSNSEGPIALIMAPTRELCMQIGRDCQKFTKPLGLKHVCVYGGSEISKQIAALKRGAEIIVCTPGRMIDMLTTNSGRVTNLKRVSYVVLDEADRMFDMGFGPQVMKIMDNIQPGRQTVLFSATFPKPMEALARRILQKPVNIIVGGESVVCQEVEQHVVVLEEQQKFFKLLEILGHYQDKGSIIVFVNKQEHADTLLKDLINARYSCRSLHGGIDQCDREATINDFKAGKINLLIATSVAARGLDVKSLVLVVNYDCPNHLEEYIHRCGRTGRAGNKGLAYTFITSEEENYAGDIIRAHELARVPVPEKLKELWDKYNQRLSADGKKAYTGGGYSGKGFKFDESEAALANEKRKLEKAALGLQDSDEDEEDIESQTDQKIETMLVPKQSVKSVSHTAVFGQTQAQMSAMDKLKLAQNRASQMSFKKNLRTGTEKNTLQTPAVNCLFKEQTFKRYEEELEINDFHQQIRLRITSKRTLNQISEYSNAGLTIRGTYVQPGMRIRKERKLYLVIQSTNEVAVSKARSEVIRLIKEESMKQQSSGAHVDSRGRYKVL